MAKAFSSVNTRVFVQSRTTVRWRERVISDGGGGGGGGVLLTNILLTRATKNPAKVGSVAACGRNNERHATRYYYVGSPMSYYRPAVKGPPKFMGVLAKKRYATRNSGVRGLP